MLDEDPLLLKAFPFTDGCFIGTAALWSLAFPLSATAAHLESLSSPFTSAILDSANVSIENNVEIQ